MKNKIYIMITCIILAVIMVASGSTAIAEDAEQQEGTTTVQPTAVTTTVATTVQPTTAKKVVTATGKVTGFKRVKLSWKAVSGAKYYGVFRATSKNGNYKCVMKYNTALTFTNKKLTYNKNYYYTVRAYTSAKKYICTSSIITLNTKNVKPNTPYVRNKTKIPKKDVDESIYGYKVPNIIFNRVGDDTGYEFWFKYDKNEVTEIFSRLLDV